jgi:hypothetical protein
LHFGIGKRIAWIAVRRDNAGGKNSSACPDMQFR